MTVILLLRRRVNEARVRGRICGLELADRFEVARVSDDRRELLKLIELIQLRAGSFLIGDTSAASLWFLGERTHFYLSFRCGLREGRSTVRTGTSGGPGELRFSLCPEKKNSNEAPYDGDP